MATLCLLVLVGAAAHAEVSSFSGVGDLTGGDFSSGVRAVSTDGSTAGGGSDSTASAPNGEAFRWTRVGGILGLGDLEGGEFQGLVRALSADGKVAVGGSASAAAAADPFVATAGAFLPEAFRWTESSQTMTGLGDLPGGSFHSDAFGVSADGETVVGSSASTDSAANTFSSGNPCEEAFRWTAAGGMQPLGSLKKVADDRFHSEAYAVSADGSVVVGYSSSEKVTSTGTRFHAVKWDAAGAIKDLGELTGGTAYAIAYGVSANGKTIVGASASEASGGSGNYEAFQTQNDVLSGLGDLPGGAFNSLAWTASDNGIIVGWGTTDTGREAFIWRPVRRTMEPLKTVLIEEYGLTAVAGWTLTEARAISPDGRTIGGVGRNPEGKTEGWVARLLPGMLLEARPEFTPVVKFTQKYSEVVISDAESESRFTDGRGSGSIVISGSMTGIDPATFSGKTSIEFRLGGATFLGRLEETTWEPGQTSATFVLEGASSNPNSDTLIKIGSVKCSWSAESFTITAKCSKVDYLQVLDGVSPTAESLEFDLSDKKFTGYLTAFVRFGAASGERKIYFKGARNVSTRTYGSGDEAEELDVHSLSVSGAADYRGPKVTIESPKNKSRTTASSITLLIESPGADTVAATLGGGSAVLANLEGNRWKVDFDLAPGPNLIAVRAANSDGVESFATLAVTYVKTGALTVAGNGPGTLAEVFAGTTQQELGATLKIKATPSAGQVLAEWTRTIGQVETVISSNPNLSYFHDTPDATLTARFIANPFVPIAGKYLGYGSPDASGALVTFAVTISKTGTFTGKIRIGSKSFSIKGNLRGDGSYVGTTAKGEHHFSFTLDPGNGALGRVEGALTEASGAPIVTFRGNRAVFSTKNPVTAEAIGIYNSVLTDPPPATGRHGYISWKLSRTGNIRCAGALADGNKFAASANADGNLGWVFAARLAAKGSFHGHVSAAPDQALTGVGRWRGGKTRIAPEAIDLPLAFSSEKFTPPVGDTRVLTGLDASGGKAGFSAESESFLLLADINITTQGKLSSPAPLLLEGTPAGELKKLNVAAKSGLFTGSFSDPGTGQALKFTGVILSVSGEGAGVFFGSDFSGRVKFAPSSP